MCCGDCLTVVFLIFDARCSWISDTDDPESNMISTVLPSSLPFITFAFGLIAVTVTIRISLGLNFGDVCCPSQASPCRFPDIDDNI